MSHTVRCQRALGCRIRTGYHEVQVDRPSYQTLLFAGFDPAKRMELSHHKTSHQPFRGMTDITARVMVQLSTAHCSVFCRCHCIFCCCLSQLWHSISAFERRRQLNSGMPSGSTMHASSATALPHFGMPSGLIFNGMPYHSPLWHAIGAFR